MQTTQQAGAESQAGKAPQIGELDQQTVEAIMKAATNAAMTAAQLVLDKSKDELTNIAKEAGERAARAAIASQVSRSEKITKLKENSQTAFFLLGSIFMGITLSATAAAAWRNRNNPNVLVMDGGNAGNR